MGNITNHLRHTSTPGECDNGTDRAIDNTKSDSTSAAEPGHASNNLIIDQPDSGIRSRECSEKQEEPVYVQVTVLSKKLRTEEDGTITLNPISESLVS